MCSEVIVVGLDGIGWEILEPALDRGELPTIASLREDGIAADLESTHPPWTPVAWPSLQSGRNPGAHGVFDFFTKDGYDRRLIDRHDIDAPYLPDVAAASERSVVSINFPVTHPVPEYEDGAVVPGYLAPEDASFHPPEIRDAYEREYGEYVIYPEYGADEKAVEQYIDVARGRRNMADLLDSRYDWDLLAVQFQVTDSVFHDLDDPDDRFEVLSAVDGFVDDIVGLGDDPDTLLVSDHGMGTYSWSFYINSWLADNGYCETREGNVEQLQSEKKRLIGEETDSSTLSRLFEVGVSASSKVGLSPRRVYNTLNAVGLADPVTSSLPDSVVASSQNRTVAWDRSDAYQIFFNSLGVHINRADREPDGTVTEAAYEDLRTELIEALEAVTDPDGNRVFDAVERSEDVYEGPHVDAAPDLLVYPRDYEYAVTGSILGPLVRDEHMNHKPEGLLVAAGPSIAAGRVEAASLYDVAPTVAALLGLPLDSDRDGSVLPVVDDNVDEQSWESMTDVASRGTESATTTADSDVEDRLANLGYME